MILITGLTGKSGGGLVDAMIEGQYQEKLRIVVRRSSNTAKIEKSGLNYEFVYGDIADEAFLREAAEGCETVFHIASKAALGRVAKAIAQTSSVKHYYMVSSTSIYSQYHSSSDKLLAAEKEMKEALMRKIIIFPMV